MTGHYINHTGRPDIPVVVRVHWSDGTESEHTGKTGPVDQVHVYVQLDDLPRMWVRAEDVKRR